MLLFRTDKISIQIRTLSAQLMLLFGGCFPIKLWSFPWHLQLDTRLSIAFSTPYNLNIYKRFMSYIWFKGITREFHACIVVGNIWQPLVVPIKTILVPDPIHKRVSCWGRPPSLYELLTHSLPPLEPADPGPVQGHMYRLGSWNHIQVCMIKSNLWFQIYCIVAQYKCKIYWKLYVFANM